MDYPQLDQFPMEPEAAEARLIGRMVLPLAKFFVRYFDRVAASGSYEKVLNNVSPPNIVAFQFFRWAFNPI